MDNADQQQNFSSKLSADVEPFVPRQYHVPVVSGHDSYTAPVYTSHVVHDIPSYITNCYPFVQEEYVRYDVGGPDISQWLGSNQYYHNIAVQPQQYPNIQVPYSPVYQQQQQQPCQYSQAYNTSSVKPKRSPQPRKRQQSSFGESNRNRRNWTGTTSGYDVYSVQTSLSYMNLGCPGNNRKETRDREHAGRPLPSRSGRVKSPVKAPQQQQHMQSNSASKDRAKESTLIESNRTSLAASEDGGQKEQPATKGGRVFQVQNNSNARYHNRTLGDFMLTLKSSKKGKTNSLPPPPPLPPPRSEDKAVKRTNSTTSAASRTSKAAAPLHGTLPNGFEIRNSDWPTAGNMKANQNKEQRNCFFGTSIAMPKPKSFADIIKSSLSKQQAPDALPRTTRESVVSGWPSDDSRMSQFAELDYYTSNTDNNLSLSSYSGSSMKNSSGEMFLGRDRHHLHHHFHKMDRNSANMLIEHSSPPVLDESLKILQDYSGSSSNSSASKSRNRRNRTNEYSNNNNNNNAHAQVPCGSKVSELEVPKSYCRKVSDRLSKKDEKSNHSPFSVQDEANNNMLSLQRNSSAIAGKDGMLGELRGFPKHEKTTVQDVSNFNRERGNLDKQVIKRPDTRRTKGKLAANVDRNKNECNAVNRNAESSRVDGLNCSSRSLGSSSSNYQNCTFEQQNASSSKTLLLKSIEDRDIASNTSTCEATAATQEQQQKSKRKKKRKSGDEARNKDQMSSLQGKMVLLSQDMYSKLTNVNSLHPSDSQKQTSYYASNGSEDYPELGSIASPKLSVGPPKKCTIVGKCNNQDDDPDWSDIDSDYESSTGLFGLNSLQELLPVQCVSSNGINKTMYTQAASSSGLSYSAALKRNSIQRISGESMSNNASSLAVNRQLSECQDQLKRTKKKKSKTRLAASGETRNFEMPKMGVKRVKPKPHQPISIDLGQMLASAEGKKKQKSYLRVHRKEFKTGKTLPVVANILDSSAPSRRRGKERETPAKKQPSALKKVILKEREERKQQRLLEQEKRKRLLSGSSLSDNDGSNSQDSAWETQGSVSSATPSVVDGEEERENFSLPALAKSVIHSRRFREYCNHVLKPEVDHVATQLLQDLIRFHNRLYHKDPIKAKSRRRIVLGLREVTKHLKLKKLKCLILAPNLDRIKSKGGLDDAIDTILALAREQNIPYVFALGRKALGKACLKQVPVSCVGIFNYAGSEKTFHRLMDLVNEAQSEYVKILQFIEKDLKPERAACSASTPLSLVLPGSSSSSVDFPAESISSVSSATTSLFASE